MTTARKSQYWGRRTWLLDPSCPWEFRRLARWGEEGQEREEQGREEGQGWGGRWSTGRSTAPGEGRGRPGWRSRRRGEGKEGQEAEHSTVLLLNTVANL